MVVAQVNTGAVGLTYMSMGSWYVSPVFHVMPLSCDAPLIPVTTPGMPEEISRFTDSVNVREFDVPKLR